VAYIESNRPASRATVAPVSKGLDRAGTEGVDAWIEPEGYRRWVARKKRGFEDQLNKKMAIGLRR
jgi:hypothetical protein